MKCQSRYCDYKGAYDEEGITFKLLNCPPQDSALNGYKSARKVSRIIWMDPGPLVPRPRAGEGIYFRQPATRGLYLYIAARIQVKNAN